MAHSLQIADTDSKSQLVHELSVARFSKVGKKYFHLDFNEAGGFLKLLTDSSKFLHFSLPADINEVFIKYENAHYLWALVTPLNTFLREHYKQSYIDRNLPEIQSNIRNLYTRWVNAKSPTEAKHLSSLLINTLNKFKEKDIYNLIIHSVILSYEGGLYDITEANRILDNAFELLESSKFDKYGLELRYLLTLYKGFTALKNDEIPEANERFHEAIILKPTGITAKFYHITTDIQLKNTDHIHAKLQSIYEFDSERLKFALQSNNLSILNYFLKNNIISNFFAYKELSLLSKEFEMFFDELKFEKEAKLSSLEKEFNEFVRLRLDEFSLEDVGKNISFIQHLIQGENVHKNVLFYCSADLIERKFRDNAKLIYDKIVEKHYTDISGSCKYFDEECSRLRNKIEKFERDGGSTKAKITKHAQESKEQIENAISRSIYFLENKLSNLNLDSKNNPVYSFKNTMTYSFVISILVFLVAGLANYSNGSGIEAAELQNTFALFVVPGIKWGAVTFLLGFLVSIFSAFSSWMERSATKQRIIQRISFLKNDKERQISIINKKMDADLGNAENEVKEMLEEYEQQIKKLETDKLQREEELKDEANSRVKKEAENLMKFLP